MIDFSAALAGPAIEAIRIRKMGKAFQGAQHRSRFSMSRHTSKDISELPDISKPWFDKSDQPVSGMLTRSIGRRVTLSIKTSSIS